MSLTTQTLSAAFAIMIFSAGAALAQGGGSEMPSDAKKQGTMEEGSSSTGMSKEEPKGGMMKKDGMMKKEGMSKDGSMEKSGGKM